MNAIKKLFLLSLGISFVFLLVLFSKSNVYASPVLGSWTLITPSNYSTNAIVVDPHNPSIIYLATNNSGIFKSTDGGSNWTSINNGFPNVSNMAFTAFVVDPSDSNTLYSGSFGSQFTNLIPGVFKSVDGGQNWTNITNQISWPGIMDMAIDPSNSNNLNVAVYSHCGGTWRTTDAGSDWNQYIPSCDMYKLLIDPTSPNIIYGGSNSVYKSTDGGVTWTDPSSMGLGAIGTARGLAMDPNNHNVLYAGVETNGIYKSTDGANSWSFLQNSPSYVIARNLITDPVRINTVYAAANQIFQSNDGGSSWSSISGGFPNTRVSSLYIPENKPDVIYATTSYGVYVYGLAPNNQHQDLNVLSLKQTSDPWKSQVYDSANKWAPTSPTINSWGCALTSGAMILKYHGINKLPNGTNLNPGTLNSWLKSQKDGYIGTGWVNWLALSRLSKLAKSINNITAFNALQYNRTGSGGKNKLTADINNLLPDILEVPGHFIVAKGISGTTFNINDPYYNRSTLNDYSNTFLTLGTYTPSYTDLSYIMLNTDPSITITVKDSNGNAVGESFIQQPLVNDDNPSQVNSPIQIFYLPQPQTQDYHLTISSSTDKIYDLHAYLYDQDGNVNVLDQNGLIGTGKTDNFTINFDQQNFSNSKNTKIVTFQSLIDDINEAKTLKLINNNGVYDSLLAKAAISQIINLINKNTSLNILNSLLNELNAQRGKHITEDAYQILLYDVNYLKSHL